MGVLGQKRHLYKDLSPGRAFQVWWDHVGHEYGANVVPDEKMRKSLMEYAFLDAMLIRGKIIEVEQIPWQPIETAPIDGTPIICCEESAVGEARHIENEGWYWAGNDPTDSWGSSFYPTHWMALPPLPSTVPSARVGAKP